ncbi:MAG: helix-turn-helix domain-containing protein [Candidatus Rokubacteria bacterium]|nr:helix-turn-helix domain-containing protein [Candidatus Rokubacteria bacterium]
MAPPKAITGEARFFLEPQHPRQRQYEALRAYFVDGRPSAEAARRFGYTPGSFRVLCHAFRQGRRREFFRDSPRGPQVQTKKDPARPLIIALRKQHLSIYDIHDALTQQGHGLSPTAIHEVLRAEGFGRLPRRRDEDRPQRPRPDRAAVADVRQVHLAPRRFPTAVGGLFVFLPWLVRLHLAALVAAAGFPGTRMIPAPHAVRAALALKLTSTERKSHVMDLVFDEGLALWAGLNVTPKTTFLSQYSSRLGPRRLAALLDGWVRTVRAQQLLPGQSFNLDFHSIPFFGADEFVEKHYVSRRSRRQKSVLAFLAQDADTRVLCYCHADLRKGEEAEQVLAFVRFWRRQTGQPPPHLVFDSQLTTYRNLAALEAQGIRFITLRRRSPGLLREMAVQPRGAWRTVHLEVPHRLYQMPKVIDQRIHLRDYGRPLRQLFIKDLGHEQPTVLLTNDVRATPAALIIRYARRMLIENGLADAVNFLHLDALSSAVALNVSFDVLLTVMATGLYRLLALKLRGFDRAQPRQIWRRFLHSPAHVRLTETEVVVELPRRAHNPILIASGLLDGRTPVPWWQGRSLRFEIP